MVTKMLKKRVHVVANAFCATGSGGGVDPTCGKGGRGGGGGAKKSPTVGGKGLEDVGEGLAKGQPVIRAGNTYDGHRVAKEDHAKVVKAYKKAGYETDGKTQMERGTKVSLLRDSETGEHRVAVVSSYMREGDWWSEK